MHSPHVTYWLARRFRWTFEYRATLLADALRWPETAPRTDNPLDFADLLHARGR